MAHAQMKDATTKDTKVKSALDHVRTAAQELNKSISDAAGKRGAEMKAGLAAIPQKAKAVTDSLKSSMGAQNEATKKTLQDAVKYLESTEKHAAESMKTSGEAFQKSVRQTIADARASVQKISEAVAATRSSHAASSPKR